MLLRVVYLGEIPAVPEPVPQGVEDKGHKGHKGAEDKGWAHALVELGSCLEYIGLPEEAARCTPRLKRALADWDVSGEPGGTGDEARIRSVSADGDQGARRRPRAAPMGRRGRSRDALRAYAEVSSKAGSRLYTRNCGRRCDGRTWTRVTRVWFIEGDGSSSSALLIIPSRSRRLSC